MKYIIFALCLSSAESFAACSPTLPHSTTDAQFSVNETGIVKDSSTGLMWMRCSLGQNWNGNTCEGEAIEMTWAAAITQASQTTAYSFNEWRLPNKNELNSLIETACSRPSINLAIFPETISNTYWTSSPYDDENKYVWVVHFDNGNVFPSSASNTATVRLVREIAK